MDAIKITQSPTFGGATVAIEVLNGEIADPSEQTPLSLRAALVQQTVSREVVGIL